MIETDDFVPALTGEEIIVDLCSRIAEKLRMDCNLRDNDCYQGGYWAKVQIKLEAYGLDTATVEAEVGTGQQQDRPDEFMDDHLEIPVEPALNLVRERSEQSIPTLAVTAEGQTEVRPRRYVRASKMVGGGATGEPL